MLFNHPIHTSFRERQEAGESRMNKENRKAVKTPVNRNKREERDGGEQRDVFPPLRPDAISGCVAAGGCRAQVAQMPQTHMPNKPPAIPHTRCQIHTHTVCSLRKRFLMMR